MPNGLNNWTFDDVVTVLKKHRFTHSYVKGSHYFYIGTYEGKPHQVCVPFHGSKTISPKVIKSIILQSGLPKNEWL